MGRAKSGGGKDATQDTNPKLTFRSPAEFFAENKNIAGFDNPGKSLYTTIRELVENGLDAAESVPVLPKITVTVEELSVSEFNKIVGMNEISRLDESLYKDVETEKERKKREAKEMREAKRKKGGDAGGKNAKKQKVVAEIPVPEADPKEASQPSKEDAGETEGTQATDDVQPSEGGTQASQPTASQPSQPQSQAAMKAGARGEVSTLRVTVQDNGIGMAHKDVPDMLGRVLAGTKYCVKQSRGKFGLGSKMALIWSKMSTSLPVDIRTAKEGSEVTHCVLDIDISKNIPNVIVHDKLPNEENWRGTEIKVTIQGSWTTYRAKILQYMRQMAIITPYSHFVFQFVSVRADKSFTVDFSRRSDQMPPEPLEVKHHPSSVNQLLLKQLISNSPPKTTLMQFLTRELSNIDRNLADRLIKELGEGFEPGMLVHSSGLNELRRLDQLLKEARFTKPDGSCLSPAGEYNLRLGIMKELKPDMVATHAETADVFEGHPFIVEVGVSLGGESVKPGMTIFRFANRIPLLFEPGNDVVTRTAQNIAWGTYKISNNTDKIGVFCSIVSTKIPFKGTGKEYIGDDSAEIKQAVKKAIQSCCVQLKSKLARKAELKNRQERTKNLKRYIPDLANAITKFLENVEEPTLSAAYVKQLKEGELTKGIIENKLLKHVERSDRQQILELGTTSGKGKKDAQIFHFGERGEPEQYADMLQFPINEQPDGPEQLLGFQLLNSMRTLSGALGEALDPDEKPIISI